MAAKLIGSILIILGVSGAGAFLSANEKYRLKSLEALRGDLSILMSELLYNRSAFYNAAGKLTGILAPVYKDILKGLDNNNSVYLAWSFAFTKHKDNMNFNSEDIENIKDIGRVFSSPDYDYQKSEISAHIDRLNKNIEASKEKYTLNSRIYRSIALSLAAFVVVLLF